jgi:hypothetical protein
VADGFLTRGIDASLEGAGLPYGYTLTIWGSGQIAIVEYGTPTVAMVFGLVVGAAAAFGVLKLASHGVHSTVSPSQLASDQHAIRTGVIHVATIAAAVGAAALVALIGAWVVWPLAGFVATLVYFVGTAAAMALHERDEHGSPSR